MADFLGSVNKGSKDLLVGCRQVDGLKAKNGGVIVSRRRDNTPPFCSPLVNIPNLLPCPPVKLFQTHGAEGINIETGEILVLQMAYKKQPRPVRRASEIRAKKFLRLEAARRILGMKHRINACCKAVLPGSSSVDVWRKKGAGPDTAGHFRGLMSCGSVWLCPVCGSKISEKRKEELERGTGVWKVQGGTIWLVTYTFSHGQHDKLAEVQDKMAKARKRLKSGRAYEAIRADFGWEGSVLAHEITHGQNGWHPHYHELVFLADGFSQDMHEFRKRLYDKWSRACDMSGLGLPSWEHGVDVRGGEEAAAYVAKGGLWGLEQELTKSHIKDGRNGNRSPGQLLDSCLSSDEYEAIEAARLWREYASAMKGRSQLQWSRGLKARLGIEEISDEEIAAQAEEPSVLVARIPLKDWKIVVKHRLQALVLESAIQGENEIHRVIDLYRHCDRVHFRQQESTV